MCFYVFCHIQCITLRDVVWYHFILHGILCHHMSLYDMALHHTELRHMQHTIL